MLIEKQEDLPIKKVFESGIENGALEKLVRLGGGKDRLGIKIRCPKAS